MSAIRVQEKMMNSLNPNDVDQILIKDLSKLSIEDRELINEELHGVRCLAPTETPDMLDASLLELSEELDSVCVKRAFDRSQELALLQANSKAYGGAGTYINTADFRLKFLRCELFDAKKAAFRLVSFLDLLMDAFHGNEELLLRPLRISDIGKTGMAMLKSGRYQLLPYRDRSGRRIFTVVQNFGTHHELRKTLRLLIYIMYVATESVESQRKGMILVLLSTSTFDTKLPGPKDRQIAIKFNKSSPIRHTATHLCFPDTLFYRMLRSMIVLTHWSSDTKFRIKTHSGQWTELQYQLMGYGIPVDILPLSKTGAVKTTTIQQWIRLRTYIETPTGQAFYISDDSDSSSLSVSNISSAIECPNLNDVIFRMGRSYKCHPGNVMFRSLIESKLNEHFAGTRKRKAEIAWWVVQDVERRGGRFLKWDNRGWWTEFEDRSEIRYKIPTYFRDFTRNMKADEVG
eukprot:CAMPEP_0168209418 /NCGR_PEP_ID=MMETSP0140_2-20121125/2607_1 /TAXON_ID=44445 /ORGANISM="Pseudo-nitzschia australis, Strain 10249 10 AB" /LENGTH=458 /DNA_ID=CAMNT_0008135913 /DNA_START=105 /DNA_END=1482 /DNA_ORIENTATION=+